MLAAIVELRRREVRWRRLALRAVHVHHGLRPAADLWARHCRAVCRELDVPLTVRRITVSRSRGESLEAAARRARYTALTKGLRRDEWLLTAHHVDDQLETLLLQLLRGAGVAGLAAMPRQMSIARGSLVRPLLGETRATLEQWVGARGLRWVEDDSNIDERFDRNYLRQRVLPLLQARWPAAATVAARSARHLGEARELLEELAASDLAEVMVEGRLIDLERFATLTAARQRNLLRHWLRSRGLAVPDARHLERIRSELPAARADAQPLVRWPGGEVRRFRGRLYALPTAPRPFGAQRAWTWRRRRRLWLGEGWGELRLLADPHGELDARALPATLWVEGRAGGERVVTHAGGPAQALKELLRVAALPPWERTRLPILLAAARGASREVIAVPGVCVAAAYRAGAAATPKRYRLRLVWEGGFC